MISKEELLHIADLAEIKYSKEEIQEVTPQINEIIDHVAKISATDTSKVEPTSNILNISDVFREDTPRPSLKHKEALKNAPESAEDGFLVPKID